MCLCVVSDFRRDKLSCNDKTGEEVRGNNKGAGFGVFERNALCFLDHLQYFSHLLFDILEKATFPLQVPVYYTKTTFSFDGFFFMGSTEEILHDVDHLKFF